ncbi:P-loop containing nucleoside triphosphate hydrolase protein [Chaetomidium leptoderma]|uniref:ATP-dependent RNA helicase n=1 Tax=Chaetomidium leptoderma TaxID=669021 RepID=A0AAN6VKE1_9PEZI|nr:P-loop containing nucleoside triphosphate hydrolase protein [Chaetomidium leptoderma]
MAVDNGTRVAYAQLAGRLKPQLLKALENHGFTHMTPVQEKVLQLPTFTQDCLVQAKTGTGKTIAFLLPALQTLLETKDLDYASVGLLVMAPTRELAQQIAEECDKLTSACTPPMECHIAVGGSKRKAHMDKFLKRKPTILVATPGRLIDYLTENAARQKLSKIRCVVLDEADRMLDAGFAPALKQILEQIPPKAQAGWQGMCFSATVPPEIKKMLPMVLDKNHVRLSTIDENEAPTVATVPQTVYPVASVNDVLPTLHSVLSCAKADNPALKAIIFCPTARHAGLLYHLFGSSGGAAPPKLPVFQMQSRMSQAQRTRTVEEFKETDRGLLFASDVVGRGMDFPDINLVVQIGVPSEKDQYVHRVGRTGRAGKVGEAVMITAPEEMWFVESNPDFPIKNEGPFNHPKASAYPSADIIEAALAKVPVQTKEQAYIGNLGFIKSLMRRYNLDQVGVVDLANRFASAFGCEEIPVLSPMLVGKMGLKGVPGLIVEGRGLVAGPPPGSRPAGGRGRGGAGAGAGAGAGGGRGGRGPRNGRGGGGGGGAPRPDGRRPHDDAGTKGEEPSRKRPRW